jgi:hypothetical protein
LIPANGAVDGVAGATVGWGFTVNWTSTNGDWISFYQSSLGSTAQAESNPGLLEPGGYTDFIGAQGGPVDFGLAPGSWTETFDGVSQGTGAYQINSNAAPPADDSGQLTFSFQVYDGDPLSADQIGDSSYSYYGSSTEFSVTVDAPTSSVPEPASLLLLATGLAGARRWTRCGNRPGAAGARS